jgi:hypothetical protein
LGSLLGTAAPGAAPARDSLPRAAPEFLVRRTTVSRRPTGSSSHHSTTRSFSALSASISPITSSNVVMYAEYSSW